MRTVTRVAAGQVWRSSDPRRLSAFRVLTTGNGLAVIKPLYPARGPFAPRGVTCVPVAKFRVTGSKGYTLMEDAR